MEHKITDILRDLMACDGVTNTEKEIETENRLLDFFRQLPYFQKYPALCGAFPVPEDPLHRSTVWALVKPCVGADEEILAGASGERPDAVAEACVLAACLEKNAGGILSGVKGNEAGIMENNPRKNIPAVVLMGHHDVVSTDVYGDAAPWAYDVEEITSHLNAENLSAEAYTDLLSGEWIFGRGSCDMLGGTAVQMALLAEQADAVLAEQEKLARPLSATGQQLKTAPENARHPQGALLFISVPDEESFSVGMRGSLSLLEQLQEQHGLEYRLAICAEPNRRRPDGKTQVVSAGSIGKLLPVVLVQGKVVQIGSYREGINPLGLLSRIVAATEGDEAFIETCGDEVSVPPVWMYARDLKGGYDFSLPFRAAGCCNVLTFQKTPAQVLAYFLGKIQGAVADAPRPVSVMTWVTLWQQAKQREGFAEFFRETEAREKVLLREQHRTFPEVTLWLMQQTLNFLHLDQPLVVLGFAPPYYPAVRSEELREAARFGKYKNALAALQDIEIEPYFTGVSDCSYCGLPAGAQSPVYQVNTPLWGTEYRFDMEALVRLQIPFFLFGPWGKDLHQIGERVNRYSLTEEYPEVLRKLVRCVWASE